MCGLTLLTRVRTPGSGVVSITTYFNAVAESDNGAAASAFVSLLSFARDDEEVVREMTTSRRMGQRAVAFMHQRLACACFTNCSFPSGAAACSRDSLVVPFGGLTPASILQRILSKTLTVQQAIMYICAAALDDIRAFLASIAACVGSTSVYCTKEALLAWNQSWQNLRMPSVTDPSRMCTVCGTMLSDVVQHWSAVFERTRQPLSFDIVSFENCIVEAARNVVQPCGRLCRAFLHAYFDANADGDISLSAAARQRLSVACEQVQQRGWFLVFRQLQAVDAGQSVGASSLRAINITVGIHGPLHALRDSPDPQGAIAAAVAALARLVVKRRIDGSRSGIKVWLVRRC